MRIAASMCSVFSVPICPCILPDRTLAPGLTKQREPAYLTRSLARKWRNRFCLSSRRARAVSRRINHPASLGRPGRQDDPAQRTGLRHHGEQVLQEIQYRAGNRIRQEGNRLCTDRSMARTETVDLFLLSEKRKALWKSQDRRF